MLLFGKLPSANRLVNPNLKELVSVPPSKEVVNSHYLYPILNLIVLPATQGVAFGKYQSIVGKWSSIGKLINLGQMQHRMKHLQ
jgi:hypothetical protein